jgi:hypothetical protein
MVSITPNRPSTYELPGLTLYGGRAHSSAAERRLCKAEALGSNPSGSMSRARSNPCPLSGRRRCDMVRKTGAPSRANVDGKGRCTHCQTTRRANETVCTCDPGVHWTRAVRVFNDVVRLSESDSKPDIMSGGRDSELYPSHYSTWK